MALFGLGPWNQQTPQFFTQAMESGARLGLAQRGEEREETTAADRLRLAYDQLHSMEKRAAEANQTRLNIGMAAQRLRADQIQNMLDFHNRSLDLQERRLKHPVSELQKFDISDTKSRLKQATKDLEAVPIDDLSQYDKGVKNPLTGLKDPTMHYRGSKEDKMLKEFQKRRNVVDMLRNKLGTTGELPNQSAEPPTVESQEDYDALPSGAVYVGEGGKKARKP